MKNAKRVLSLMLALAMILTVAAFPAFADTYIHESKTVYLEAGHNSKTGYSGPYLLARPTNDLYVGDKIALPDEGLAMAITVPQASSANITGFILNYGKTSNEVSHGLTTTKKVYVGVDANGVMTGFYPTLADMQAGTNKTTIELTSSGKWLFAVKYFINSQGNEENFCGDQNVPSLHNIKNPIRWTLDVKEAPTSDPTVNVPTLSDDVKNNAASILSSLTTDVATFADNAGQNQAYVMDVGHSITGVDVKYDSIPAYGNLELETLKAALGKSVVAPVEGFRIDFDTTSYVKAMTVNTGVNYIQYDVFGSLDGENWYAISKDNTASAAQHIINVDSVVKYLRVDYRDYNDHWGSITTSIKAITGVLNVFPTETYDITFKHIVSEEGETQLSDATVTTDANGLYTVPSPFDSDIYEYYSNEECTVKFDVTATVNKDTIVYVKLISDEPDEDVAGTVKVGVVIGPKFYCGINFIERPINDLYVGNKIVLDPDAVFSEIPTYSGTSVAKVRFFYGVDGGAMQSAYMTIDAATGETDGFFSDLDCTTPLEITLDTAGTWMFYLRDWYDANGVSLNDRFANFNESNTNHTREMFFFTVKPATAQAATAPSVHPGVLANVRDILSTFDQDVTESTTANVIYYDRTSIKGSTESVITLTEGNRTTLATTSTRMSWEAIRLDFLTNTYVKDLTLKRGYPSDYFKYNVFGSVDGENWYLISKNNEATAQTFKVEVNTVVKYLRIDQVSGYYHWGTTNSIASLVAINGYEDVDNNWRVTYSDNVIKVNALSDENGVITVPEDFTSKDYDGATSIDATAMIYGSDELKLVIASEVLNNLTVPMSVNIHNAKITLPMALIEELAALNSDITLTVSETMGTVEIGLLNAAAEVETENMARVMFDVSINEPTAIVTVNGAPVVDSGILNGKPVAYSTLPASVGYLTHQYDSFEDAQASDESVYIRFVTARNILSGITAFEFVPQGNATRWMALDALMNLSGGSDITEYTHPYTDVATDAPYANAAQWGYEAGLTGEGTTLRPDDAITKSELSELIYGFAVSIKGVDDTLYTDAADYCTTNGIMGGANSSVTVTRGELAKVLTKFVNVLNKIDEVNYDDYSEVEFDEDNIVLSFAAMSDVHIDSLEYNNAARNYENAMNLAYELSGNDLDMVFVAGDVTQNLMYKDIADSRLYEIDAFKKYTDLYLREGTAFVFCTGNHDRYSDKSYEQNFYDVFTATAEDVERYYSYDVEEDCEYDKGNRHAVVNGYHFLSVGMYQDYSAYLTPILDRLTAEDPNKPIFVQYHFHAEDTVYETHYSDSTEQVSLKRLLEKYPQVVYFSGHTHNALENPRAIWQGGFTALDTGAVRYLDDNSLINYNVKIPVNATHSEAYGATSEATLVQVDANNNIRFISYNTYRGDVIAEYVIAAPSEDNTHLITYSDDREAYSAAPIFRENTDFTLTKTDAGNIEVFFDAATHDDIVWYYTLTFKAEGEADQIFYFTSRYFDVNGMPDEISATLYKDANIPSNDYHKGLGHNLTEGVTYTVELNAYDAWDHMSDTLTVKYIP